MRLTGRTKRIVALATVTILTGFASSAWAQNPEMAGTSSGEGISGGPSTAEAQRALQNRIEQQSSGRITLLSFKPTATKFADVELENRVFCLLEFEAQVGFTEPCRWAFQSGGRPLTFNTLKPREQSALVSAMPGASHRSGGGRRKVLTPWLGLVLARDERVDSGWLWQIGHSDADVRCAR